uniref:Uncharacterized protein n=1 Tax=Ralstonia solanacearum TaxID=305 RepID=A0A0S4WQ46_RALSL|nr:protein of unknown function [Ralstonia solanacearum]
MQACYPHLKASGEGRIIHVGSMAGVVGLTDYGPDNMAKEAVRADAHRSERMGADNITVNNVLPVAQTGARASACPRRPTRSAARGAAEAPVARNGTHSAIRMHPRSISRCMAHTWMRPARRSRLGTKAPLSSAGSTAACLARRPSATLRGYASKRIQQPLAGDTQHPTCCALGANSRFDERIYGT